MRFLGTAATLIAIASTIAMSDGLKPRSPDGPALPQQNAFAKCRPDSDQRYRRQQVLEQIEEILKKSIPTDMIYFGLLHVDREGKKLRFFVHDLTEPANTHPELKKPNSETSCIRFVENHVYHFAPSFIPYSFSHIAFLENGEMKVFKLLNCEGKGDSLDDVVAHLNQKLKDDKQKDQVISRVKNYRQFGYYYTIDETVVRCRELNAQPNSKSRTSD